MLHQYEAKRSESTINLYLAAVSSFYDFHDKMGVIKNFPMFRYDDHSPRPYKGLLHHISKGRAVSRKRVRLKPVRHLPKTLTTEQMKQLLNGCNNKRDKFLISLLMETGMRIGQALGLRHSDLRSMDNEITIVPRAININQSRQKTNESYVVHVSKELMALYTDYLIYEFDETDSDYVFVNLWEGQIGQQ